jgi:Ca2+-binding RTX toxin-like protein
MTLLAAAVALLVLTVASSRTGALSTSAADAGSADNFLIDMDPSASPANAARVAGSFESCARINDNGITDADEESDDAVVADIVTGPVGIPASHPMIGFALAFYFPADQLVIADEDQFFMLNDRRGSSILPISFLANPGEYISGAIDASPDVAGSAESGPGVLSRLTIALADDATEGIYDLVIGTSTSGATAPVHVDTINQVHTPGNVENGTASPVSQVAIDVDCPAAPTPPPTPTPGPTPAPTPVPSPAPVSCVGTPATIVGTEGNDRLRGTRGNDVIVGLGGADRIDGLRGGDLICGGPGNDRIHGGAEVDLLFGDQGDDRLTGDRGDDQLFGGPGADRCRGGHGADSAIACERVHSATVP